MGDVRFDTFYERVSEAERPWKEMGRLDDEGVIAALAGCAAHRDPYLANVLATEAMNRAHQKHTIVSSLGEGVCALDAHGRITFVNPAAEGILGWDAEALIGRFLDETFHPRGQCPLVSTTLRTGETRHSDEETFIREDGRGVPAACTVSPILREGSVEGVVLVFRDITERLRAEETRRWLAAIVESTDEAIIGATPEGRITSWNSAAERLFGYRADEVLGESILILLPPEHRETELAIRTRVVEGEFVEHYETERLTRDGSRRPVSVTLSPVRDAERHIIGLSAIIRDITERKEMEDRIRESERQYRFLTDNATDVISLHEPDGTCTYVSPAVHGILGYAPEEVLGTRGEHLAPAGEADPATLWADLRAAHGTPTVMRRFRHKDGRHLWLEITARAFRDPHTQEVTRIIAVSRDVTDRKNAQDAVWRLGQRLRALIQASPVPIVALGDHDRVTVWNPAAERCFGRREEEVIGKPAPLFGGPDAAELRARFARVRRGDVLVSFETRIALPDGDYRDMNVSAAPVEEDDHVTGVVAILVDMTEEKRASEALHRNRAQLEEAERVARVGSWEYDVREGTLTWSPEMCRIFGVDPETFTPTNEAFFERLHPADRPRVKAAIDRALEDHRPYSFPHRIRREDGALRRMAGHAAVVEDEKGNAARIVGTCQDVTDEAQAKEALEESEDRFRTLIEHAADAFFVHDADGRILEVNRRACEALGYTREELLGMRISDVETGLDPQAIQALLTELTEDAHQTVEGVHRRKDGSAFPVEVRLGLIPFRGRKRYLALARDITVRKRAQEEVRALNERLEHEVYGGSGET